MSADFVIGAVVGANVVAAIVLVRLWWRGELDPKWPKWM